jgi:hypothetical protein
VSLFSRSARVAHNTNTAAAAAATATTVVFRARPWRFYGDSVAAAESVSVSVAVVCNNTIIIIIILYITRSPCRTAAANTGSSPPADDQGILCTADRHTLYAYTYHWWHLFPKRFVSENESPRKQWQNTYVPNTIQPTLLSPRSIK